MMLFIRLTGLLDCVGILVFGVYKTVEGIRINEMIEEISTVVETTPLVPPVDLPDFGHIPAAGQISCPIHPWGCGRRRRR